MTAEEIMTSDVVTVEETDSLADAYQVLQELSIRHVPVVRGSEIVGMLSDRDFRSIGLDAVADLEELDEVQSRLTAAVSTLMSGDLITVDR